MTCPDTLTCLHEPFGDAFYFGPERISPAWTRWPPDKIENSGRANYTYGFVLKSIHDAMKDPTKRIFLKDMSYHIIPPSHSPNVQPPSLRYLFEKAPNEPTNPSLFPTSLLRTFQFVFLIRKPSSSMPSLYRCFIPPLSEKTGEAYLDPTELGYRELRMLFDYLYPPGTRTSSRNTDNRVPILIDADDLLAHPESILRQTCSKLGLPYDPAMLSWDTPEDYAIAEAAFRKYAGYHEDALNSKGLRPKTRDRETTGREAKGEKEEDEEWRERYGGKAARTIRQAVDLCHADYEYLKESRVLPEVDEEA